MDIDVERGSPEPEGGAGEEEARDEDTHAIVSQLERGLPGWPGFDDVGWSEELREVSAISIFGCDISRG
jgi:chromatin structure-remodeling complex subunit RSC1/2